MVSRVADTPIVKPTTATILVVDDEPMVREVVARYLQVEHYRVVEQSDGAEARRWLERHRPDLVVLDVMLPEIDGFNLLRFIRSQWDVPVIMLTARADETDRVVGLELGADDYVVKPFSPRELVARIRNVLRRSVVSPTSGHAPLSFDGLHIDVGAREVTTASGLVELTPKEFDLLVVLAQAPRQVFSRRQLLELVWESAPEYQDPATVTVHVGRLRQKIEEDPARPRWIVTARGVGYRFEP
jgi:DNA-binding response OmpR family regulator